MLIYLTSKRMKIKDIKFFLLLLFSITTMGQVGIGTEKPEATLDVYGSVRIRKLSNSFLSSKMLLANEKGELGYVTFEKDAYQVKDIFYRIMTKGVHTRVLAASIISVSTPLIDLSLDITVEVAPHTTTAVTMEYNVPITTLIDRNSTNDLPGYIGITLVKREGMAAIQELDEGSRKFTFYKTNAQYYSKFCTSMPVSGRATDVIINNTDSIKKITYSAMGYIESGRGDMYFGEFSSGESSFGAGVFIAQVYQKD